jgi:hypothetical protein
MFLPGVHVCRGETPPIVHVVFLYTWRCLIMTGVKEDGAVALDDCRISRKQMPDDGVARFRHGFVILVIL